MARDPRYGSSKQKPKQKPKPKQKLILKRKRGHDDDETSDIDDESSSEEEEDVDERQSSDEESEEDEPKPKRRKGNTFSDTYRFLSKPEAEDVQDLTQEVYDFVNMKQPILRDDTSKLTKKQQGIGFGPTLGPKLQAQVDAIQPLHLGSIPELREEWDDIVQNYSGHKTGKALYAHVRSKFTPTLNQFAEDQNVVVPWKPELHHALPKARREDQAVNPDNLLVMSRGSTQNPGQHDTFHQLAAGGYGNRYQYQLPGMERLLAEQFGLPKEQGKL